MSTKVLIETPCDLRFRDVAGSAVRKMCALAIGGLSETTFEHHVISAFNEAFNNVAKHGKDDTRANDKVAVAVWFDPKNFEIEISSYGVGFDGAEDVEPDLDDLPESGMGLFIMKSFMDVLQFTKGTGDAPNVVYMKKSIRTGEEQC